MRSGQTDTRKPSTRAQYVDVDGAQATLCAACSQERRASGSMYCRRCNRQLDEERLDRGE